MNENNKHCLKLKISDIQQKWSTSKQDRTEAALQKEKDLESIQLQFGCNQFKDARFQSLPFLVPKDEKNADIINDILKKSLETQATEFGSYPLVSGCCFEINGLLMYYFKYIPGKTHNILS